MWSLDPLTVTIIFILVAGSVGAFVRGRRRDKCLKDFAGYLITMEEPSGKRVWGRLRVEATGLELVYAAKHADADGHVEGSFILYKNEFVNVQALLRFHDDLTDGQRRRREMDLKRTYHPGALQRLKRRTMNVFRTIRDSVAEVVNVLLSQAQKRSVGGGILVGQDKYVSQMKDELIASVGTSYEPLLERHIGHVVVVEMVRGNAVREYPGVLKEYTADFVELMDVNYETGEGLPAKKADVIVPRRCAAVRHLGE
ncbi:MAG: hypothetical protein IH624_01320 [Phycisphaerae bacterium]|nr:hypothetical protein [Phycisphaerae bacterium]